MTTSTTLASHLESIASAIRQTKTLAPPTCQTTPRPLVRVGTVTLPRPLLDAEARAFLAGAFPEIVQAVAGHNARQAYVEAENIDLRRTLVALREEMTREIAQARSDGAASARQRTPTPAAPSLLDAIASETQAQRQPVAVATVVAEVVANVHRAIAAATLAPVVFSAPTPAKPSTMVRVTFPASEQSHILREAGVTLDELRGVCRWVFADRANPKAGGFWQGATPAAKTPARNILDRLQRFGATIAHV